MKNIQSITYMLLLTVMIASCKKENKKPGEKGLKIDYIFPDSGKYTDEIKIIGKGFGARAEDHMVKFNGKEAEVLKVVGDTIVAQVPFRAGTGMVTVKFNADSATGPVFNYIKQFMVSTVAGTGVPGHLDGPANVAQFYEAGGITTDPAGNILISDTYNNRIRKITPEGMVTTLAGSLSGFSDNKPGPDARFDFPIALVFHPASNAILVADMNNHRVRHIDAQNFVTTNAGASEGYMDGNGAGAKFSKPSGITMHHGTIYVADSENYRIRKIEGSTTSTLAGSTKGFENGSGAAAMFDLPTAIAYDSASDALYVTDYGNNCIRKVTRQGLVSVFAGDKQPGHKDGLGTAARFNGPTSITTDGNGNVYVADTDNHLIRKITSAGMVSTIAGTIYGAEDGPGSVAKFKYPLAVHAAKQGILYVSDQGNRIRQITFE